MLESAKSKHLKALDGISQLQAQMTFRFSVLSKLLDRQMTEIASTVGLSLGEYRALATISAFPETTAADLVRYTGYDKSAMSRLVSELERKSFIAVVDDPKHGRRKNLTTTTTGKETLEAAAPLVDARRAGLSSQLSDEEEQIFLRSIEKLAAYVAEDLEHTKNRAA